MRSWNGNRNLAYFQFEPFEFDVNFKMLSVNHVELVLNWNYETWSLDNRVY